MMGLGVEAGEIAQHIAARFIEEQGLDDGQLAAVLLLVGLFDDAVKKQCHQNDLQRHESDVVDKEDGDVVKIPEDQVMHHVHHGGEAEQHQHDLL